MKKSIYLALVVLLLTIGAKAQLSVGSSSLNIKSGTTFSAQGLVFIPSADISIASNSISFSGTAITNGSDQSIDRVYSFASPLSSYSGLVGIQYSVVELNGNAESALQIAYNPLSSGGSFVVTSGSSTGSSGSYYVNNTLSSNDLGVITALPTCENPTDGGTIASDHSICAGEIPNELTSISEPTGHTGTLEYQWQSNTTSSTFTFYDIIGANSSTFTSEALTTTTWFKRLARVDCMADWSGAASSNVIEVTVHSEFSSGEIETTGETICYNTSPTTAIGNTTAASGGDNTITYSWRSSSDSYTAAIDGATLSTYTPAGPLTSSTSYRRYAKDNSCNTTPEVSIGTWTVTVQTEFASGEIETTGETICYNTSPTTAIGNTTAASGGDNTITYSWRSSSDSYTAAIDGAILSTYTPAGPLTSSTSYRRFAKDNSCNTTPEVSIGTWTVTVQTEFTSGEIETTGETICYNTSPTTAIGNTTAASGGDNTITYSWRSSSDGYTAAIDGAILSTYTPAGPLTSSTSYRRYAKDNSCNTTPEVSIGTWTVTVEQSPLAGLLTKTPDVTYVCQSDDVSASLTAGSGGNGTDELEYRTKTGLNWSNWIAYTSETEISGTGKTGIEIRTRRISDYCTDSEYTTVSWTIDQTNPLAVAKVGGSVNLNPAGDYTLTPSDVLSSYSDAGVGIETITIVPASVSCANLGLLTVTVTVIDYCGNQTVVTPQITVLEGTALLSPWVRVNTSPAANGTADYSSCTNNGTFHLTSTGVSAPKSDVMNFVYQPLCGNGTVIARLSDVVNGGWAGVMMRESNAPGAKTVLFKTKLYNPMAIVGVRSTTNGNISNTTQNIPNIHWMKIQRTNANTFVVYTSYNGTTWIRRYTATVAMNNCINAGIFTENAVSGRITAAWFDHVEVVGYLKETDEENTNITNQDLFDVTVYPNPANDRITISIPDNEEKVKVTLINASGLVVETSEFESMDVEYYINHIKPGMYLLRFERDGMIVNKRLVVL